MPSVSFKSPYMKNRKIARWSIPHIKVFTGGKIFYGSLLLISKVLRQFAVTITSVRSPTYYQLAGF